jgi:uncharacterized protein YdeI (YjbR/CyaY-like superfamily)
MSTPIMNPLVDDYLGKTKLWPQELTALRKIILECNLIEELKWKQPCYTDNKKNIVMIGSFKDYAALIFFKGVLLQDAQKLLHQQGENVQSSRIIKFTNVPQILKLQATLKAYIFEAISVEKEGLQVSMTKSTNLNFPEELFEAFKKNNKFQKAFEALTPGRQRGYNLYFTAAKQSKTRAERIAAYLPRIISGKGFHDCVCGLSQKMPTCDGSHKLLKMEKF